MEGSEPATGWLDLRNLASPFAKCEKRMIRLPCSSAVGRNVSSGGQGGAITAALFLRRFVSTKSWLHLDVFAWTPAAKPGRPEGAECQTARALYAMLTARYP